MGWWFFTRIRYLYRKYVDPVDFWRTQGVPADRFQSPFRDPLIPNSSEKIEIASRAHSETNSEHPWGPNCHPLVVKMAKIDFLSNILTTENPIFSASGWVNQQKSFSKTWRRRSQPSFKNITNGQNWKTNLPGTRQFWGGNMLRGPDVC